MTDSARAPAGARGRCRRSAPASSTRTGGFDARLLEQARHRRDVARRVARRAVLRRRRARRGLDIVGDIELFARAADAPVVGITGTNGKSTVTTLVRPHGRARRRARARRRQSRPAGARPAGSRPAPDLYVLELSSFQLETTHSLQAQGRGGAQRDAGSHGPLRDAAPTTRDAKARIFAHCETAVVNADDRSRAHAARRAARASPSACTRTDADFSLMTPPADSEPWLARRGAAAAAGGRAARSPAATTPPTRSRRWRSATRCACRSRRCSSELREFTGLPHRAQWVADIERRALHQRFEGHQRRRDAGRGRRPRRPAGADRRRRRQGPGLHAAAPRRSAARCAPPC